LVLLLSTCCCTLGESFQPFLVRANGWGCHQPHGACNGEELAVCRQRPVLVGGKAGMRAHGRIMLENMQRSRLTG
jgi:hypothetical protein